MSSPCFAAFIPREAPPGLFRPCIHELAASPHSTNKKQKCVLFFSAFFPCNLLVVCLQDAQ